MSDDRQDHGRGSAGAEPDPSELEAARGLAERLDRALAGERVPVDEPLAAALMLHSAEHETGLGPERRRALLDQALGEAGAAASRAGRRARLPRWAPALAVAASLLLLLGSLLAMLRTSDRRPAARRSLPSALQSRSADELMGRPFEDRAGASQRLDLVFADRLAGYRQICFGPRSWR